MRDRKGVLVVGSLTQDFVEAPGSNLEGELGGSATYSALAARHFGPVAVVGAVGRDRAAEFMTLLDFADLSRVEQVDKPTYTWRARRTTRDGVATTLERFTGAFDGYAPELGPKESVPASVFLGSCDPKVQLAAVRGCPPDALIGCDSMDIFIESQRAAVEEVVRQCHVLFATVHELELLAQTRGVGAAALRVFDQFRLNALVVKLGAEGAVLWTNRDDRQLRAYPTNLVDPTGAGDALAGAFIGRLNELGDPESDEVLLEALEWGIVTASFAISGIGVSALKNTSRVDLEERLDTYRAGHGATTPA